MNYDYSTIIAIYKDGTELFRLYEGSVMLWEKPLKRFYVYVDQLATLQSVIDRVSTMTGSIIKMQDSIILNNTIKATSDSGYVIELYIEGSLDGSAKPSILTDIQDGYVNVEDHLDTNIKPINGTAKYAKIIENNVVNNMIAIIVDNNVYLNVDENILFSNQLQNVSVGSIWYIAKLNDDITISNTINSIIASIEYVELGGLAGISSTIKPNLLDELTCEIHSFDSLSTYIEFVEQNGLFTSISASDGLSSNIKVTMFRFSKLQDFDDIYLYDMDGETLEQLKLIEE